MAAQGIPDAISFNEDQVTSIPTLTVQSTNLMANFDASTYPPSIQILIEGLKHSVLFNAFTIFKSMPLRLVSLAFSTAIYLKNEEAVQFEVDGGKKFSIRKSSFTRLIGLPVEGVFVTPTAEEMVEMFNHMGYSPPLTRLSQFKKSKLPVIWNVFFTFFKRCLTGRKGGQDSASQLFLQSLYGVFFDVQVDYGSILWHEFVESLKISTKDVELSCHRFWSVILESAYREKRIPYNAAEEPQLVSLSLSIPSKIYEQVDISGVGNIPEAMLNRIPATSTILLDYRSSVIKPIPIIQDPSVPNAKRSKKRKEQMTTESHVKPTKQLKKGDEVQEESSKQSILNRLLKKPKSHTPKFETIKRSKHRRQILTDDPDDDILPISQVFSIAPLINIIEPTAEEPEADIVNKENTELEVQHMEYETEKDELMVVSTEAMNEEVMGGEDARIETEKVCDEVVKEAEVTKVGEETTLVDSDVEIQKVLMVENEEEIDATEENRIEKLHVVNDSEQDVSSIVTAVIKSITQQITDTNEKIDQSCSGPPPISNTISEPILNTISEPIPNTTSDTSIYDDLHNLNVRIHVISPVIPTTSQQKEKTIMFENISFTEEYLGYEDEDLEMAPIDLMKDDNENDDENELMSIKQFRILNRKLNMILRISECPADLSTSRESELEKVSLEWNEKFNLLNTKMTTLAERFDGFKDTMQQDNTILRNEVLGLKSEVKKLDDEVRKLNSEIAQLSAKNVEDLKVRIDDMNKEKASIQKALDAALSHIQFLEPSVRIYDQKELADDYNEKVVQHVETVQRDFMTKLVPLQKLLSCLPKVSVSKSDVPVDFLSCQTKSTAQMSFPLFSQAITKSTIPISIPQRIFQKGIVIGSSAPIQTTSTVVTTHGGSRIGPSDKGKGILTEMSKEESKMHENEARDKLRQQLSLIRQGEFFITPGVTKVWTEDTIRDIAFGEDIFISFLPKQSYNTQLQSGMQLDLPIILKLFTVKCFRLSSSVTLSSNDYNEYLIRFYGRIGIEETKVWSLSAIRKIIKVEKGEIFENIFQNFVFTVDRGDSKPYVFTLADLPVINPMDLIQILKLLFLLEKIDVSILINHLRSLLQTYVLEIATQDMIVAKALGKDIIRPLVSRDGLNKIPDGKIIQKPEWGIVFSATVKGKKIKRIFRMDDRGKFSNEHILAILKRIVAFDENSTKETSKVSDHLNWTMAVRKVIQEAIPIIFNQ